MKILVLKFRSKKEAFSLIEIIFGIVLFGVILALAIPRLSTSSRVCELDLGTRLATVQNEISILFMQAQLTNENVVSEQIISLLRSLSNHNTARCSFILITRKTSLMIKATSKNQSTSFRIKPIDFSSNPKIYCPMKDILCRKINYRTKEK